HNADDIAETVVMNVLRGDIARLQRCTAITTGSEGAIPRSKPFKYTYEKEIVMYAHFKKLDYFSTECIYSPNAYRGHARAYLKDLEAIRPTAILDIIHSGECMAVKEGIKASTTRRVQPMWLHLEPGGVQGVRHAGGPQPRCAQAGSGKKHQGQGQ
ncbi:hypothetical protein HPB47_010583, partial [Ixodes persulcatus]